jgi:hypothetical protein
LLSLTSRKDSLVYILFVGDMLRRGTSSPSFWAKAIVAQILGYLPADECSEFQRYAGSLNLDTSALANLLILRELAACRLSSMIRFQLGVPTSKCAKVTAHQAQSDTKQSFVTHARNCGLKPAPAATILFRAELEERWLAKFVQNI